MRTIHTYQVYPNIPPQLNFLEELARNLWWTWEPKAQDLFRRINPRQWKAAQNNPITFLMRLPQSRFKQLIEDEAFLTHMEEVRMLFDYEVANRNIDPELGLTHEQTVAYFSMEFGIHESLPLFSGGLGILAGDHLKATSTLGLPLVGVGLLYRQGYFRQFLNPDGWQQEAYPETDYYHMPIRRITETNGQDLIVSVTGPAGEIRAAVWELKVGRVPLYLLDTNIQENKPELRDVTARLYSGGSDLRLSQEALLGIGGMRALRAMNIRPHVCHMNEGHSAFCNLERLAQIVEDYGVELSTALEIVPRTTVFTTHTPVAAGHDEFPTSLIKPVLAPFAERLGIGADEILDWGQVPQKGSESPLSMFVLGMHLSQFCNGVSELHGQTARRMWSFIWPDRTEEEIPIGHITNGVSIRSVLSPEIVHLMERYLGPEWPSAYQKPELLARIDDIYEEELWRAHEISRARLIRTCRERMVAQCQKRNAPRATIELAESVLDGETLTIGIARRFATYKRADLLLRNTARLEAMLNDTKRPVQFIFAGKAHPKDNEGKALIRRIVEFSRRPAVQNRIIFLEDYDMGLARYLVRGCDAWLNTPRRPMEACGTSGMKAAVNGGLNVSILDGWWCEGYTDHTGWALGHGEVYEDPNYQDSIESEALYNTLENHVIPSFYERQSGRYPVAWLAKMKSSIKMVMAHYGGQRMVSDYSRLYYAAAADNWQRLTRDQAQTAKALAEQTRRLKSSWDQIELGAPVREELGPYRVDQAFNVTLDVFLGELAPHEVVVELYFGNVQSADVLTSARSTPMTVQEILDNGRYRFGCDLNCRASGRFGFSVRVRPAGDDRTQSLPGMIKWA